MEVIFTKTFTKQFKRCPKYVQEDVKDLIVSLSDAVSLNEISEVEKLTGFKKYFRIRIGQYRVGVKQEKPKIFIMCVLERSRIYKVFPPKN